MDHLLDKDLELKDIKEVNGKKFFISTIKMEIRHSWINQHKNVYVYETMVFDEKDDKVQYESSVYDKRYTTYDKAVKGHQYAINNIEDIVKMSKRYKTED
ncbi:hypothetical protein [Sulfurospirillum arcachonense]|uniref:hypothetical protein n=1 Tax=Sulfurospirillum arcachonense TaxID=57666 RepID=UPI000469CED4|nr:hypothetical protein [Sulfurospirillum arcachonense]